MSSLQEGCAEGRHCAPVGARENGNDSDEASPPVIRQDPPVDSPLDGALGCVDDAEDDGVHEPVLDCLGVIVPDCFVGRVCRIEEACRDAVGISDGGSQSATAVAVAAILPHSLPHLTSLQAIKNMMVDAIQI